ncbi:sigma-54 interaction domain-containing protein [Maledivibacter halophilus]|uniref:Transcriptional regulator containing PAS, AAA-type ATPase, and DNA-binding Fis domains n=1 Tax=Maledivibacter halophilus TaxID=36842 RepID=A0A1T5M927_9FIRM|nr:sigma 54-interacting transcriptional regulator [Maledivibacter halophilus]SKC84328.1 Transcriptional regulator containing PAS, AAA-type ATPase, and DNA-binding Fis domains [Maledivibacter halophilus]
MVSLKDIAGYIEQTANIIGGVLELDVLIVDDKLRILGDSDLEEVSQEECISKNSILTKVMDTGKLIVLNSKLDHKGCLTCKNINNCPVTMIIGIPLLFEEHIIGSVGVIGNNNQDKEKILKNKKNYLKFINRMIELIINKLVEEKELKEISLFSKRIEVVLDSIDQFLVLISNDGKILNSNSNFKKIFKSKLPNNINDILEQELVKKILVEKREIKYKEIRINKKYDFLLSSKPVILHNKSQGAVLNFRSIEDITKEMNDLYTPSMDVEFDDLIGRSYEIKELKEKIKQISGSNSTVLINGETGTGKEVVARLIHNTSKRKDKPFVAINCSAIPEELMESELFGYEEGAFSGARKGGKIGKFQLADGGTIFLDEIGEMALHLQSKLLRVLQEKCITKIGGLESNSIDVRIISATNKKLEDLVLEGKFREDLYYRLKVIPLTIPPLRERLGDVELLLNHFLKIYSMRMDKKINSFSSDALKVLIKYPWYGNVRELKNVVEFSVNMTNNNIITVNNLPKDILHLNRLKKGNLNIDYHTKQLIAEALKNYGDTTIGKEKAAMALGISMATLYRKMKEYNI